MGIGRTRRAPLGAPTLNRLPVAADVASEFRDRAPPMVQGGSACWSANPARSRMHCSTDRDGGAENGAGTRPEAEITRLSGPSGLFSKKAATCRTSKSYGIL
jgi:hypothetical protein